MFIARTRGHVRGYPEIKINEMAEENLAGFSLYLNFRSCPHRGDRRGARVLPFAVPRALGARPRRVKLPSTLFALASVNKHATREDVN